MRARLCAGAWHAVPLLIFAVFFSGFVRAESEEEKFLRELVAIDSGTENVRGVNLVHERVARELKALGFAVELKSNDAADAAKLLVATLKGESPRFVTLIAHADTVFEASSGFTGWRVSADGKTATGPGVGDDKGGIVVALSGLKRYLADGKKPKFSLRFVSSPSEETGSAGFLDLFRGYAKDSAAVLSFEPALSDGSLVSGRRGNRWYDIRIVGKEAHAGRSHKDGVNACHELAIKLDRLQKLTDYARDVTVSIGHVSGGQDKYNIVCGEARAKVDTRFASAENGRRLHADFVKILETAFVSSAAGETAKTEYRLADDSPAFSENAASKPFLERYAKIVSAIEARLIVAKPSGASADTNYMSVTGVAIVDGLGPIAADLHTQNESVDLASLRTRALALEKFLLGL